MTKEQRDNLKKLADYLIRGKLKAGFDMSMFMGSSIEPNPTCRTVACAVGHGPSAGIKKLDNEDWNDYSERG